MRFRNLVKHAAICALIICAVPIFSSWARGDLITTLSIPSYTPDDSAVGSFGAPTTSGTTIQFPSIHISSISRGVTDTNSCTFTLTSNNAIQTLNFSEGGNLGVFSNVDTGHAKASISVTGSLQILDGPFAGDVISLTGFSTTRETTGIANGLADWGGEMLFNLAGKNATQVSITLKNEIYTSNSDNAFAFVGATAKAASISVVAVPEPASLVLLGMGALAFVLVRKRK